MEAAPHSVPWRAVAATHPCSQGATRTRRKILHSPNTAHRQSVCQGSSSQGESLTSLPRNAHTAYICVLCIYRLCSLIKLVLVGKLKTTLNSLTKQLGFYASKTREFCSFLSKASKKSPFSYKNSSSIHEKR